MRIGSGITPRGGASVYLLSGRPFVRSQNIGWGDLRLDDVAFIGDATHATFPASEIRDGDVLLNITGASIGRCAVATVELAGGNVNQHVCEIRLDAQKMDPHFVNAVILSDLGQRQIDALQAGGNRQGLNFQQVGSIHVPNLDLGTQRMIANALNDTSALAYSLERLIAKKRAIKQGMMQELLTGRTRLPVFEEPWSTFRLGDHLSFVRSVALARAQLDTISPLHYLHYGDIHTRTAATLDALFEEMTRVDARLVGKAGRLKVGDLVFADASEDSEGVGKSVEITGIPSGGLVAGLHTIAARFDKSVLADGFKAYLQFIPSFRDALLRLASGTKVLATTKGFIAGVELALPCVNEQRAIAAVLSDADTEIITLERRLKATRAIKQGMMQELLTGRTRLPVEGVTG